MSQLPDIIFPGDDPPTPAPNTPPASLANATELAKLTNGDAINAGAKYNTVADLVALPTSDLQDGNAYSTLGRVSQFDGGGNTYIYDVDGIVTADGGFYINHATTGQFVALDKSVAYWDQFGAVADDPSFDNRLLIKAAVDSGAKIVKGSPCTYYVSSTGGLLTAVIVIDHDNSGITLDGDGGTIKCADGSMPANVYGIVQLYARYGNTVEGVTIKNLTVDGNEANNNSKTNGFHAIEAVAGDYVNNLTMINLKANNCLDTAHTGGSGFLVEAGNVRLSNLKSYNCWLNFGFINGKNPTEERHYQGSDLWAENATGGVDGLGFDWSGTSDNPGKGLAVGIFTNLTSINTTHNKCHGPWDLKIKNFVIRGANNNPFWMNEFRAIDIDGITMEDCGNTLQIIPSANQTAPVHYRNVSLVNCGSDAGVNVAANFSGEYHVDGLYIDMNSLTGTRALSASCAVNSTIKNLRVVNVNSDVTYGVTFGANTGKLTVDGFSTKDIACTYSAYILGEIDFSRVDVDKKIWIIEKTGPLTIRDSDFSTVAGTSVLGSGGNRIDYRNCTNFTSEANDIVELVNGKRIVGSLPAFGYFTLLNEVLYDSEEVPRWQVTTSGGISNSAWSSLGTRTGGQLYDYLGNVYWSQYNGTFTASGPTHTSGTTDNLTYIGPTAVLTAITY